MFYTQRVGELENKMNAAGVGFGFGALRRGLGGGGVNWGAALPEDSDSPLFASSSVPSEVLFPKNAENAEIGFRGRGAGGTGNKQH